MVLFLIQNNIEFYNKEKMGSFMKYFIITLAIIYTCTLPLVGMHRSQDNVKECSDRDIVLKKIRQCPCGQEFTDHKEIRNHIKKTHRKLNRMYYCPASGCSYECKVISTLLLHFSPHTREIIGDCDQCNITFTHYSSWSTHKSLHKEYPAQFVYLLRSQPLTKNAEGIYECPTCDYSVMQLLRLLKHVTNHLLIESNNTSEPEVTQDTPAPVQNEPYFASAETEQILQSQWTTDIDESAPTLPPLIQHLLNIRDSSNLTLPPLRNYFPEEGTNGEEEVIAQYILPAPLRRQFQEDELGDDVESSLFPITQALLSKAQSPILGKREHEEEKKKRNPAKRQRGKQILIK